MMLVMAKKGVWVLEQPSSSLAYRLKRFQDLCRKVPVPLLQNSGFCSPHGSV